VNDAAAGSRGRWWQRPLSARSITLIAFAMIIIQSVVRGIWTSQSWFLVDDFLFTSDIARGIDGTGWYLRLHNGHFMPLSFGLVKLVTVFAGPFAWAPVAAEIIALQLLAALTCWWMLRTVFGNRPAILLGLGFYLFSPLTMTSTMWWAVAINQLPYQIAFFGMIAAHIKFCRGRQWRWLMVSSAFLTIGYLSYAKTPLLVLTIVILTVIWFSFGPPWQRFWISLRRYRAAWFVYGVISLTWLVTYLAKSPPAADQRPSGFLDLLQAMVVQTLLPTFVGGPWDWVPFINGPINYGRPPLVLTVLAAVVIGGVVTWAWAKSERSLLILWAVAAYVFASAILIFSGRAFVLSVLGGEQVGRYLQYISDIAPLISLALVAMFVPVVDSFDPMRKRPEPFVRLAPNRWILAAGVAVLLGSSAWSSQTYTTSWRDFGERTLTQRGVEQIESERPLFADVGVPLGLLSPLFGENSAIKNYFAPLGDVVRTTSLGNDLKVFDGDMQIAPAGLRDPASPDLDADPSPRGECLDVSTVGRWYSVAPPPSFGLWIAVDYRTTRTSPAYVAATRALAPATLATMTVDFGTASVSLRALPGRHRALIAAPTPHPTIHVAASPDLDLCVISVRYGLVGAEVSDD